MAKKDPSPQKLTFSTNALEAIGLNKQPFVSTVLSNKEIYLDSVITQLIDSLKHHMQFSPLLLIVEGAYGSGKTTLFRHLSQSDIPNIKLLSVQAEASDTLIQIQHKMSFHLQEHGSANYLDDNLKHLKTFDSIPVLVIDDAHTLSDTVLQEILRYKTELKKNKEIELKILLMANPGMAETIEKISNLEHNQLYVQTMPAFNEKQILNFCQHRLLTAGYSGQPLLDNNNAQQILKKSDGLPGNILDAAIHIIEKNLKKKNKTDLPFKKLLLPALSAAVIIGLGLYFLTSTQTPTDPAIEYIAPALPQPEPAPVELTETAHTVEEVTEIAPLEKEALSSSLQETIAPPSDKAETVSTISTPETPEPPAMPAQPAIPAQPDSPPQADTVEPLIADNTQQNEINNVNKLADSKLIISTDASQKKTAQNITGEVAPVIDKKPLIISKPALHPALTKLSKMGLHEKNWLLKQNANHWTLQILGARDPETLLKFASQHKLGDDSAWFETRLDGKPWYIIVHRFYTDKDIARAAIARLPGGLQTSRPWVKSVASIHQALE